MQKKVEILSVGTELLMGQIANTNAQFISRRLPEVGLGVFYHSVVGDNPERLTECLHYALSRSDVVITTGGLGPTQDDLTKEVIAKALGLKMVLDIQSEEWIKEYFMKLGKTMTDNNLRQAYFPEGCKILDNDEGTAPGCLIEQNGKVIILLPGPPKELIPMFNKHIIPYFREKCATPLTSKFLRVVGIGESMVEKKLFSRKFSEHPQRSCDPAAGPADSSAALGTASASAGCGTAYDLPVDRSRSGCGAASVLYLPTRRNKNGDAVAGSDPDGVLRFLHHGESPSGQMVASASCGGTDF